MTEIKKYETLSESIFNENGENFGKCESFWNEITEEVALDLIETARQVSLEVGDYRDYLEKDKALKILNDGDLILLPTMWIREKNDNNKCPFCGRTFSEKPALSRRDNETWICPTCGMKEALEDMLNRKGKKG